MNLRIVKTNSENPDFVMMESELEAELNERNGDLQQQYNRYDNPTSYLDTVVLAYDNDTPVGCGCFRPFDDSIAEIKRMFVRKEHRRRGIASIILMELELWAGQHDFIKLAIENSLMQPEAKQLYAKYGYKEIPCYGQYANIRDCFCMQKLII